MLYAKDKKVCGTSVGVQCTNDDDDGDDDDDRGHCCLSVDATDYYVT